MEPTPEDAFAEYRSMKTAGSTPTEACARAAVAQLDGINTLRMLRTVFGLSFQEAKDIVDLRDGNERGRLLSIKSHCELIRYLREELHYCGCDAYEEAVHVLREALQLVAERWKAASGDESLNAAEVQDRLEVCVGMATHPGVATWFLYMLNGHGLIGHGGRVSYCWLEPKGELLLNALLRFGAFPGDEDATADPAYP